MGILSTMAEGAKRYGTLLRNPWKGSDRLRQDTKYYEQQLLNEAHHVNELMQDLQSTESTVEDLGETAKRLENRIEDAKDENEVDSLLQQLQDIEHQEEETLNSYSQQLEAELDDIRDIVSLCESIIQKEHREVLYDIRQPITITKSFLAQLIKTLEALPLQELGEHARRFAQTTPSKPDLTTQEIGSVDDTEQLSTELQQFHQNITEIVEDINEEFDDLLSDVDRVLQREVQALKEFKRDISEKSLQKVIQRTNSFKKQITGDAEDIKDTLEELHQRVSSFIHMCEHIKKQLDELDVQNPESQRENEILKEFVTDFEKILKVYGETDEDEDLRTFVQQFSKQIDNLLKACDHRVRASANLIVKTALEQNKYEQRLEDIEEQLDAFYREIEEQEEAVEQTVQDVETETRTDEEIQSKAKNLETQADQEKQRLERETEQVEKEVRKTATQENKNRKRTQRAVKKIEKKANKAFGETKNVLQGLRQHTKKFVTGFALLAAVTAGTAASPTTSNPSGETVESVESMHINAEEVDERGCAKWVINAFADRTDWSREFVTNLGIVGNAWNMLDNLTNKEGTFQYVLDILRKIGAEQKLNLFPDIYASNKNAIQQLHKKMRKEFKELRSNNDEETVYAKLNTAHADKVRSFFPQRTDFNVQKLQTGDIVGLYYEKSVNQARAFLEGISQESRTFNTHVGIVAEVRPNGTRVIAHNIKGDLHYDRARDLLTSQNRSHSQIVWAASTSVIYDFIDNEISHESANKYINANYKITNPHLLRTDLVEYVIGIDEAAPYVQKRFGLANQKINALAELSFGIMKVETEWRTNNDGVRKADYLFNTFDRGSLDIVASWLGRGEVSRGPSQITVKENFTEEERERWNINEETIHDMETAGKATVLLMAKRYMQAKQHGWAGRQALQATVKSWPYGPRIFNWKAKSSTPSSLQDQFAWQANGEIDLGADEYVQNTFSAASYLRPTR